MVVNYESASTVDTRRRHQVQRGELEGRRGMSPIRGGGGVERFRFRRVLLDAGEPRRVELRRRQCCK